VKKLIALLVVAGLTMSGVVGCGGTPTSRSGVTTGAGTTTGGGTGGGTTTGGGTGGGTTTGGGTGGGTTTGGGTK